MNRGTEAERSMAYVGEDETELAGGAAGRWSGPVGSGKLGNFSSLDRQRLHLEVVLTLKTAVTVCTGARKMKHKHVSNPTCLSCGRGYN